MSTGKEDGDRAMTDVNINTADGEQWARMYAMALKREQELLAERDRLRKLVEKLSSLKPSEIMNNPFCVKTIIDKAQEAD